MDIRFTHNGRPAVVQFTPSNIPSTALDEIKTRYPDAKMVAAVENVEPNWFEIEGGWISNYLAPDPSDLDTRLATLERFIPIAHELATALGNYVVLGNGKATIGKPAVAAGRLALGKYQELIESMEPKA